MTKIKLETFLNFLKNFFIFEKYKIKITRDLLKGEK